VVASSNKIRKIDAVTNIITTVAGTGMAGYTGDGGPAISATFNGIFGICIDIPGNIYLVDQGNNVIRKVAAGTGTVTTIAGTGTPGYSGDGGLAILATLNKPVTICVGPASDIYFTDQGGGMYNSRIREISATTGIISTIAGSTSAYPVFGGLALSTWLGEVTGLCMSKGSHELYCNEISCSCRRMDMVTDTIYAVGGNFGIESFSDKVDANLSWMNNPYGLCMDVADNIYVADNYNNRIRKLIQLTHTPSFAYGKGQSLSVCPGVATPLDSLLAITDMDSAQTETWTVVTAPAHGTLSGFPMTASSMGTSAITTPGGASYTMPSLYTGTDSFQVKVSDGTLSEIVTIYVSMPGAGNVSGANSVCLGSTSSIFDDVSGGTWSTSDPTVATISASGIVTGINPGTASIMYSVFTACGFTMTSLKVITIEQLPTPGAMAITGSGSVCTGATIILADPIGGGAWTMSNPNATVSGTGIVTGVSAGLATVLYAVTNSCGTATATHDIEIADCGALGIRANSSAPEIRVFPNPASSALNVAWSALQQGAGSISIADVTGRVVLRNELTVSGDGAIELNISGLKDGVYLLSFNAGSFNFVDKVVISK